MAQKRLRELGELPPLKTCKVCGKTLKQGSGTGKAYAADLCWQHWKQSTQGKLERRRLNLAKKLWAVSYFGKKPNETEWQQFPRIKQAITASYVDRTMKNNGPVAICWSDGEVTLHWGLTQSSTNVKPEDGEEMVGGDLDPGWFRDQVDDKKKTWFVA